MVDATLKFYQHNHFRVLLPFDDGVVGFWFEFEMEKVYDIEKFYNGRYLCQKTSIPLLYLRVF